jgi:hypothetical protein
VTINANGYSQTKTEKGWQGTHTLILEKKLGRQLRPGERAIFKDNNRRNLDPDNIELTVTSNAKTVKAQLAKLYAKLEDVKGQIAELELELKDDTASSTD